MKASEPTSISERLQPRAVPGTQSATPFVHDLRYAARQFRRAPGYAAFSILVLALGIGTVTAMFTIGYAVLIKPLPFRADRRLFQPVEKTPQAEEELRLTSSEIAAWQQATRGRAQIAFNGGGLNIADGPGGAVLISQIETSANLFDLLGTRPLMGRTFLPEDAQASSGTVMLSYALWQQDFAGDPNVVGKQLHVGGMPRTIIGVMPPQFTYPVWVDRPQVWVPASLVANSDSFFAPIVRINAGTPVAAVETQLARAHALFAKSQQSAIHLAGIREMLVADARPAILALAVAVAVVWLIACTNVAGLMLARVMARRREIAVRAALGAARRRIATQFLAESIALSAAGAIGGLGLAAAMLRIFRHMLSQSLPLASGIHLNWPIFTALAALTLLTAMAFGAAPALIAARTDINAALKSGGKTHAGDRPHNRARTALLVTQVALSVALLIAAGLMLRTMYALRHVPLGFRSEHLVLTSLTIPNDLYANRDVGSAVWLPLLDDLRRIPGVRAAALSTVLPIQHPVELITNVYATPWMTGDSGAIVRAATPGLTDALGVRLLSGRFFSQADSAASLPVTVVNQTFVNRFLGGNNPLGKVVRVGRVPRTATIIGVIENLHQDSVAGESQPEFYLCLSQIRPAEQIYRALLGRFMQVAVRSDMQSAVLIAQLRQAIHQSNPHLAIGDCTTMTEAVEDSIGAQKMVARVIAVFGAMVLLVTLAGLYGLLNYLVTQRTQEIGVRMALGADRSRVVAMVMRHTLALMLSGTAIGIALALLCGRLLERFLFGVKPADPWTIGLTSLALLICGLLAAVVPTGRAANVNPVEALRAE